MTKVVRLLRNAAERTSLAAVYRSARDEWRFARITFADTPFGYRFAGMAAMRAGTFEQKERAVLQERLAAADLFIDVGANVGYFTCMACALGKPVIAVEPVLTTLRYLYANLQVNGWGAGVEIYPVGLADKPRLARLYGAGTGASLVPGWHGVSRLFQRTIPLSTLDILLANRFPGRRLVVKMDVEGAEYAALLGAVNTLQAFPRSVWLVEIQRSVSRTDARNPHFLDTFELFRALGYAVTAVDRPQREISRAELEAYAGPAAQRDWATNNYLFTPNGD